MSEKQLKPEQKEAIELKKDLLLSANAGSGKTFVMMERVIHSVLEDGASVLDFLMITFTDAASLQMRTKLQSELLKKYKDTNISPAKKAHIKKQLALVSEADISTIHTFCFKLIKKYFYVLNLNAGMKIADDDEAGDLKEKAFNLTLDAVILQKEEKFFNLMSSYNNKRNFNVIKEIVFKIYSYMQNLANPQKFKQQITDVYTQGINNSAITEVINEYVCGALNHWKVVFLEIKSEAIKLGFEALCVACDVLTSQIDAINLNNSFLENHKKVFEFNIPQKPRKTKDEDFDNLSEYFASFKDQFSKDLTKIKKDVYLSEDVLILEENLLWCKDNIEMLLEIEEKFAEKYKSVKLERNLLDFSDLEHFSLEILKNKQIGAEISKRYKQIFVDEYQDVNDIQEEIITSVWKEGKSLLFLVGDPKQSIYRFRNTNPKIMIDKIEKFSSGDIGKKAIPLNYNFRSDENILNFSNFVFSKIMTSAVAKIDYEKDGMFKAGLDFPKSKNPVVELGLIKANEDKKEKIVPTNVYSVKEANFKQDEAYYAQTEAYVIAEKIANFISGKQKIYDADKKELRNAEYRDMAILFRSRGKYVDEIINTLEQLGVPVKNISEESVLEKHEVQVLYSYLKLLITTNDDYALTTFLTSPIINLSFNELASIAGGDASFADSVLQSEDKNEKVKKALNLIREGREELASKTIYQLLNWLIFKTHYDSLLLSMPNGKIKLVNVKVYVNDFLSHTYNQSLINYISYVENNENIKNGTESSGDENAVNVLTMHHSKGLEFPVVFAADMAHQFNTDSTKGASLFSPNLGIGVQMFDKINRYKSSTLARSAIIIEEKKQEFAEQLRVLYVGLTRAKNFLYVVGKIKISGLDNNLSAHMLQRKNNYLSLILSSLSSADIEALKMGKEHLEISSGKGTKFAINLYSPIENLHITPQNVQDSDENDMFSEEILQNISNIEQKTTFRDVDIAYKNSVSRIMEGLNGAEMFTESPKKFKVSEHNASADEIGTAYHKAMEVIPFSLKTKKEVEEFLKENLEFDVFNLIDCGKIYKCLNALKQWTLRADKIIREGKFYLNIPYNKLIKTSVVSKNILIQGVVDFVAICGDEVVLIDYKTTRELNDDKLRKKYEIQMECYKIAVENALKKKVTSKILYSFFKDCAIFVWQIMLEFI